MSATPQPGSSAEAPPMAAQVWALPKEGEDMETYEDAARARTDHWPVRAAVADGATESAFSAAWAEHLTQGLVDQGAVTPEALRDAVPNWQAEWHESIRERVEARPWYVAAKAAEGAFAALLGLSLRANGSWRAVSVGDCCLFQVRDGALVRSWPFGAAEAFTNRPALVPSASPRALPSPEAAAGDWAPGDAFLLATDAVAAWLLDANAPVDPAEMEAGTEGAFRAAVERARAEEGLRNDDTTLLVLRSAEGDDADHS